jgi:hypothetical protein
MKAKSILDRREVLSENAFVEMVLWCVPEPVTGCTHSYKYSLAYVVNDVCVLRYDNERGKGDHRHMRECEQSVVFSGVDRLLADFMNDVMRWNDENRNS